MKFVTVLAGFLFASTAAVASPASFKTLNFRGEELVLCPGGHEVCASLAC